MTVQSVQLTNFRGFANHTVSLDALSILVGQNNAGKSTFVDAMRLMSVGLRKAPLANFTPPPSWCPANLRGYGFRTTFESVDFDFDNVHRNHDRSEPAQILVRQKNRRIVRLLFGPEPGDHFFQVVDPRTGPVTRRADLPAQSLIPILVMPPIGPLLPHEKIISRGRVKEHLYGRLAHRHFRNQLNESAPAYRRWEPLLSRTWPTATVSSFEADHGEAANELSLIVRDGPFATEVAWMGSGIQAWMQLIWFICRSDRNAFVLLDEPDVYLHADLQRKVVKLLAAEGFKQIAIATHSSEIISDVDPSAITVIRKRNRYSLKPGKNRQVQDVIDQLGSRHNIQLGKLGESKKLVLYEGDDRKFLSQVAMSFEADRYNRFMSVPYFDIQGVENWHQAIGAARALEVASGGSVKAFLIIDRDFRTDEEVEEVRATAEKHSLDFHCWSRKEIESYLANPIALSRYVSRCGHSPLSVEAAEELIEEAARQARGDAVRVIHDRLQSRRRKKDLSPKEAEAYLDVLCSTRPLAHVVSGKRLLSNLSTLAKAKFGCQLNAMNLCREFREGEWDSEIKSVAEKIAA